MLFSRIYLCKKGPVCRGIKISDDPSSPAPKAVPIPFGPGRIGIILFVGPGYPATRQSPVPLPVHPTPIAHMRSPFPPSLFSRSPLFCPVVGYLGTLPL